MEKLAASLADAQVDLNPHQVEAALFAFRSHLSKGAILADEVGLGKTIEAGILLSQRWAERKRKILIIVPAALRKQWHQELSDKFFLPSVILETKTFNEQIREGNLDAKIPASGTNSFEEIVQEAAPVPVPVCRLDSPKRVGAKKQRSEIRAIEPATGPAASTTTRGPKSRESTQTHVSAFTSRCDLTIFQKNQVN